MGRITCHAIVPLRHEGDGLAEAVGNFLRSVFDDGMIVSHGQGIGIAHVDFFLARPPFSLGIFYRNARSVKTVAQRAHIDFFLAGLQDVVIFNVVTRRLHIAIALAMAGFEIIIEQEKLELRREVGFHLHVIEALQLFLQNGAR